MVVNNQNEFNKQYDNKEVKEIETKHNRNFRGQLVIRDYSEMEKLYLRDVKKVDKITLENLTKLQECTIWNCGTSDLIIDNCPQIKKLNIRSNLLVSLEFLKSLPNLEELELDGNTEINSGLEYLPNSLETFSYKNTKLTETLKPYQSNWKSYQKVIQELVELVNQKPQELLKNIQTLKEEIKNLKEKQPITIDNPVDFENKYQTLKKTLDYLLKKEQIKTEELVQLEAKSREINLTNEEQSDITTTDLFKKIKEDKNNLSNLQKSNKELKNKLVFFEKLYETTKVNLEKKIKELEELKNAAKDKLNDEEKENLEDLLEAQGELIQNGNISFIRKQLEKNKIKLSNKLTIEELDNLCQLQEQIIQLELRLQKKFNQVNNQTLYVYNNQVVNQQIKNIQGFNIEGDNNTLTNPSVQNNTMETITYETETNPEFQAAIEVSPTNLLK